jgi:hypothetical protein
MKKYLFLFGFLTSQAFAQTLLEEDFQGVIINNANQVKTVGAINTSEQWNSSNCASAHSTPSNCADSSVEDVFTSFTNTGTGNASAASFNVRNGINPIDQDNNPFSTFGDSDFDNRFGSSANKFLVIGDDSGDLSGNPNGGVVRNGSSLMQIDFPLSATHGTPKWLTIEFDYVFDANNTSNSDDFWVELVLADNSTIPLLSHNSPSAGTRGTFFLTIPYPHVLPVCLRFSLREFAGAGSSAVGIDNIAVRTVPPVNSSVSEPGILMLFGLGLFILNGTRVLKHRN